MVQAIAIPDTETRGHSPVLLHCYPGGVKRFMGGGGGRHASP